MNAPPTAVDDDVPEIDEDTIRRAIRVLDNDVDPDDNPLTASLLAQASDLGSEIDLDPNTGHLRYDPRINLNSLSEGEVVQDTVWYAASDSLAWDSAAVRISVRGVNDLPIPKIDSGYVRAC